MRVAHGLNAFKVCVTLVVLDSATPPRVGPGRFVFVNVVPPDVPLENLGRIERPTVMDWDRNHPVMRGRQHRALRTEVVEIGIGVFEQ